MRAEVAEGEWDQERVILIEFATSSPAARGPTPEHVEVARDRIAVTEEPVLFVHGLEG